MKRINVQNDVESRQRISRALEIKKRVKKEVADVPSEEVPEYPIVEIPPEPETPKKSRRKTPGDTEKVSV